MKQIQFNGKSESIKSSNISELLLEFGLSNEKKIAVEVNQSIVSRPNYESTLLKPNDQVEIVHFVGGG